VPRLIPLGEDPEREREGRRQEEAEAEERDQALALGVVERDERLVLALRPLRGPLADHQVVEDQEGDGDADSDQRAHHGAVHERLTSERNSSRVARCSRKMPSTEEVTMVEFCFSTPRIIIHRCRASIITPTPLAPTSSMTTREISSVRRSCSCRRRAYMSTSRASLLTPKTLPSGM